MSFVTTGRRTCVACRRVGRAVRNKTTDRKQETNNARVELFRDLCPLIYVTVNSRVPYTVYAFTEYNMFRANSDGLIDGILHVPVLNCHASTGVVIFLHRVTTRGGGWLCGER